MIRTGKARHSRHGGGSGGHGPLTLIPMIDVLMILVVSLLVHSADTEILPNTKNIAIPHSVSEEKPRPIIMLLEGIAMQFLLGTAGFDIIALAKPLIVIALPSVALIAAFAVLFESVSWLRGGLGNVLYFFFFLLMMVISGETNAIGKTDYVLNPYFDFSGWQIIGDSVSRAAQAAYPEINAGFTFSFTPLDAPKLFTWDGIPWTTDIYLSRLVFLALTLGLVMTSALFFDRFNPSRLLPIKRKKNGSDSPEPASALEETPRSNVRLTPLASTQSRFRFDALFLAELKLFIKGQPWWWYAIALGLVIAQLTSPLETTRILLIVGWVWHILILSTLGNRETRFDTLQVVFSAPHPISNQLPAAWLSAFVVTAALGSGALVKFIVIGETFSILGWLTGVLFIPSLALALGGSQVPAKLPTAARSPVA